MQFWFGFFSYYCKYTNQQLAYWSIVVRVDELAFTVGVYFLHSLTYWFYSCYGY